MISLLPDLNQNGQIPLFRICHQDHEDLLNNPIAQWFSILYKLPWKDYRVFAALYYDALYQFNKNADLNRQKSKSESNKNESIEDACQRVLFDRVTMQGHIKEKAIIYQQEYENIVEKNVDPNSIAPNVVPERFDGKKPKCFFSLFKSFIGVTLIGDPPEPEKVYKMLINNPSYARVCGFVPKHTLEDYSYLHVPSLRKLEQFDQIMTEYGIWDKIKLTEVTYNIKNNVFKIEDELVADTTHYFGFSGFETVKYIDDKGKEQKKSQSKMTKNCRCSKRNDCAHKWKSTDEGAGTIVKSCNKMYWGHKASIIGFPSQGIPLDMVALLDGATHDGESLYPHLNKLFNEIPEIKSHILRVLYDSACDDQALKKLILKELQIELKTSFNPRGKKEVTENLPRGLDRITSHGYPICKEGHTLEYNGKRTATEKYIFQSPTDEHGVTVCITCPHKMNCCPDSDTGRTVNISFDLLPHINSEDPHMAKRFKTIMTRRTSVERMIKRIKCDMSDDRLTKRGNVSFQAYLDKSMIALHIMLRN